MIDELELVRQVRPEVQVPGGEVRASARRALDRAIADCVALPARRERLGWLRRPSRRVTILLAALVMTGSAAAAVLSLSTSKPLVGRVPGTIHPASLAGYHYRIAVTPILFAGTGGWQPWIVYNSPGTEGYGERGTPLPTTPIFAVGGPTSVARGETVAYVLTGPQVFAVRIGGLTIRTVSSPTLPTGDRAAVFFIAAKGPGFSISGLPGPPPGTPHPPTMKSLPALTPLDRSGRVIATQLTAPPPPGPPTVTWMARDAVTRWWPLPFGTVPYHDPGYHGRTHPGPGVCELAQRGLPALHAQWGHTVTALSPVHDALGQVFLSCIDAAYYLHGWPFDVAVLVDGRHPGQVLGPIPGAQPVPGQPGIVSLATGHFPSSLFSRNFGVTAKRLGNAWLVVQGGSGLAQRLQVVNALRISKLDLHHPVPGRAPHNQRKRRSRT